jgi:hypothetical protein
MAWSNDGTVHKTGIANEKETTKFLQENAHLIYGHLGVEKDNYTVRGVGGTDNKEDNVIECDDGSKVYISDKLKNKGLGGSITWKNTSKIIKKMIEQGRENTLKIQSVKAETERVRGLPLEERAPLKDHFDKLVTEASQSFLSGLTSDEILSILEMCIAEEDGKEMQILITDGKENKRYTFPFSDHPVVGLIENGYTPEIKIKKNARSGSILFSKDGETRDVWLRFYCKTNNGQTALIDASGRRERKIKTNSNSHWTFNLQQDGLKNLINYMGVEPIEI